jgi:NAD(P)-dependent dehydrogenase (short-subunit alcohol dehydrogenase family)
MAADMKARVCVVTGATQGIGKITALELARMGAEVTIVARSPERGQATLDELHRATGSETLGLIVADLSLLSEIRDAAEQLRGKHPRVHVLVNNAGAIHMTRKVTPEGLETTFVTNHLSYFLLTELLLPALEAAGTPDRKARIVNVASNAHLRARLNLDDLQAEKGYTPFTAYGNSKLGNILFTYELARRLEGKNVTANCLHPGVVATGFGRNDPGWLRFLVSIGKPFLLTPEKGARTTLHVATSPELEGVSGQYFVRSRPARSRRLSYDEGLQRRFWEVSAALTRPGIRTA